MIPPVKLGRRAIATALLVTLASSVFAQITNGDLETPQILPNSWIDRPTNFPGWAFVGRSGVGNGSTPLASGAYTGNQYAFLATQPGAPGKMTQTINGFTPGVQYRLRFWMRTRPGFQPVDFCVNRNGVPAMRVVHSFGIWIEFATDWFTAEGASSTFDFYALDTSGDKLTVIDNIRVEAGPPPPLGLPLNPSFELPAYPQGSWDSPPGGMETAWQFYGSSGIEHGPSSWGSGAAHGVQYAFMQNTSYFNQLIGDFQLGHSYHVQWYMARRNGNVGGNNGNPVRVLLDQNVIFPAVMYDNPVWKNFASKPFTASNLSALLQFEGTNNSGDRSELIDHVRIFENSVLAATNYSLIRGSYLSGDLSSLLSSNDVYLRFAPGFNLDRGGPPLQVEFETTCPFTTLIYLALDLETACSNTSVLQKLELWDYANQQWVLVSQVFPGNTDSTIQIVRTDDANQFVNGTTGKIRSRVSLFVTDPTTSRSWQYRIDQLRFYATPF